MKGDARAAIDRSKVIRRDRDVTGMSHPLAIEPHAVVARSEGTDVTI